MTKCVNKLKELKDNKIEYRENLIQLLGYANIHKEPIAVNDPLVVIRNMLKARIHKLDFRGMLEARGNIHQLSKLENLGIGKSVAVVELIVQLKIENKLHDFIAAWKRLNSVAPKSEVLITN